MQERPPGVTRVLQAPPAHSYETFSDSTHLNPDIVPLDVTRFGSLIELNRGWKRHVREHKISHGQDRGYQRALREFRTLQRDQLVDETVTQISTQPYVLHGGVVSADLYDRIHDKLGLKADNLTLVSESGPTLAHRVKTPSLVGHIRYEDGNKVKYAFVSTPEGVAPSDESVMDALRVLAEYDRFGKSPVPGLASTRTNIAADAFPILLLLLGIQADQIKDHTFFGVKGKAVTAPYFIGDFKPDGRTLAYTLWKPSSTPTPVQQIIVNKPTAKKTAEQKPSSDRWVRDTLDTLMGIIDGHGIDDSGLDTIGKDWTPVQVHKEIGRFVYEQVLPTYQERFEAARDRFATATNDSKKKKSKEINSPGRSAQEEGRLVHRLNLIEGSLERIAHHAQSLGDNNRSQALITLEDTDRMLYEVEKSLGIRRTSENL